MSEGAGEAGLADRWSATAALFSESTGRIVLTCSPARAPALVAALAGHGLVRLGGVEAPRGGDPGPAVRGGLEPPTGGWLQVRRGAQVLLEHDTSRLRAAFQPGGPHV